MLLFFYGYHVLNYAFLDMIDQWISSCQVTTWNKVVLTPDVCQVDIILLTVLYLQVDRSSNERVKSCSFSMVATNVFEAPRLS